MTGGLVST